MINIHSYAYCVDMTGVHLVKIFKVIGSCYKRQAKLGDIVFVVVRGVDTSAHYLKDDRLK